jgi:hypothetical protein
MLYLLTQRQVHEVNYFNSFMLFIRTIATDKPGFACWVNPELVKRDGENLILPYPAKVKISDLGGPVFMLEPGDNYLFEIHAWQNSEITVKKPAQIIYKTTIFVDKFNQVRELALVLTPSFPVIINLRKWNEKHFRVIEEADFFEIA